MSILTDDSVKVAQWARTALHRAIADEFQRGGAGDVYGWYTFDADNALHVHVSRECPAHPVPDIMGHVEVFRLESEELS